MDLYCCPVVQNMFAVLLFIYKMVMSLMHRFQQIEFSLERIFFFFPQFKFVRRSFILLIELKRLQWGNLTNWICFEYDVKECVPGLCPLNFGDSHRKKRTKIKKFFFGVPFIHIRCHHKFPSDRLTSVLWWPCEIFTDLDC